EFIEAMKERGIGVGVHYQAIHLFSTYRALGYTDGQFPNAERIGRETVTLPLFPAMELADVDRVVEAGGGIRGGGGRGTPTARCSFRSTTSRRACRSCSSGCIRRSMPWGVPTRWCSSTTAAPTARWRSCASSSSAART